MQNILGNRSSYSKILGVCIITLFVTITALSAAMFFVTPAKADSSDPYIWTTDEYGTLKNDFEPGDILSVYASTEDGAEVKDVTTLVEIEIY